MQGVETQTIQTSEIQHETTLFTEPIFHIGSFTVTNSLLNSWIVVVLIILISVVLRKKISIIPKGVQNVFEIVMEQAFSLVDSVTGSRERSMKFLPVVLPLFVFILLNNWLGIFPGIGSIGFIESSSEGKVFIPLFRGATADLNTTLALAIMAVIMTHVFGVLMAGGWSHLNRFFGIKLFLELPKRYLKKKSIPPY